MKKLAFLALAVVAAGGCSESGDHDEETPSEALPTTGVTNAQIQAFKHLEATTHQRWRWLQNEVRKTPLHLSTPRTGKPLLVRGADPVYTTLSVLEEHKALFRMKSPHGELAIAKTEVDHLGMTHARFQQTVRGVPVAGAELMAHYDAVGRLTSIDANYVADIDIDVVPKLAVADALALVKADIVALSEVDESTLETDDEGKLVVFAPESRPARLAYQSKVRALAAKEPAIWVTTIDAKTGEILDRYNNLQTIQGQGVGVLSDVKTFEVLENGNGFVMTDAANGVQIRTYTARQQQTTPGTQVTSNSATSWDTGVPGAGAAVDAHFNAAAVFKYYKEKHARNAIDGAGGAMISTAHFGQNYDNAAWDGRGMLYGDGGQIFRPLSVSLDVVAHEFTHGVTEKTSNLVYQNQPGALNEAVSDIFGAFIEHAVKPDEVKNWAMGETVVKNGSALRDMRNPQGVDQPQPAHMTRFVNTQQDNGGVHINSGIINNAAFLMTSGGTNPVSKVEVKYGIGWDKSEKLWYRANTRYFMQNTNFAQAAQGVLQAAKDVGLTQNEINIVECAFKATGIAQGTCATLVDPKGTDPTPGGADPTDPGDDEVGSSVPGQSDGDDTSDDDSTGSSSSSSSSKAKNKRRRVVTQESGGCSAAAGGSAGFGQAVFLGLALGLAALRRKKEQGRDG
jgi:bacillolysin